MKLRKFIIFLIVCLLLSAFPAGAIAMESFDIGKVLIETYPGSGGNDLPYVSQDYSAFYCKTSTSGVVVSGWSLVDGNGTQCSGKVENKQYTLSVNVTSQVVNSTFSANTAAYINNVPATISVSGDGLSATVSRVISPKLVGATIWKDPGDEKHDAGNVFSFTASASPYYNSVQWYLRSPYNESYKAEDVGTLFPNVTCTVHDRGSGGTTCNFNNVPAEMDGWMVYCAFIGEAGQTLTKNAFITVTNAAALLAAPSPSPEAAATPEPTIYIVETPEPTNNIWIVEEDWSEDWSYDTQYHWHASKIPQNNKVNEKAAHDMTWTETKAATKKEAGEETGVCSVCGYTETKSVEYVKPQRTGLKLPSAVKWVGGILGGIIVVGGGILGIQYLKDKAKRKRRAKMSGRTGSHKH